VARKLRRSLFVGADATNTELVAAAAAGDPKAWDALVERYTALLWSITRSHRLTAADAADVVQTTWLRLVEHLSRITDPERLPGWLATTARREAQRVARRGDWPRPGDDFALLADDGPSPGERLLRDERDAALWSALALLDEACQRLLRVLIADPAPLYADVAVALGMKVGSIGPTRQRCLAKLRRLAQAAGLDGLDDPGGLEGGDP
jgi:RNA polymerase sigma factor (sigma-70 family)